MITTINYISLAMVCSKHLLVETEDGADEYSGINDNPDEYQKAADYCFQGFKPCGWGRNKRR